MSRRRRTGGNDLMDKETCRNRHLSNGQKRLRPLLYLAKILTRLQFSACGKKSSTSFNQRPQAEGNR